MAQASSARRRLSRKERSEGTRLIAIRVPRSWHRVLVEAGATDALLGPIEAVVKRLNHPTKK